MDFIRKIGHNEIVKITTPVLITWHDGKSSFCGDFIALNNYTEPDRYPIPRIPLFLDNLPKPKYVNKMDCMKSFHHNGFKPKFKKLVRIIFHMGLYELTRMPFGIKNAPAHIQRMMDTIFQEETLKSWMVVYIDDIIIYSETWEDHVNYIDRVLIPKNIKEIQSSLGFASYYRNHIQNFAYITSSLYKLCSKYVVLEITQERRDSYGRIKHELTNEPFIILPDFELPFKLYIDASYSQGLGAAIHQRQIVDGEPREQVICYISRQLKYSEARYEATQTECLCLVWALEKLRYSLEGAVFEFYTDCTSLKSLLNLKTTNRHMLRWKIFIQ
ncbi:hypothetical protein O181_018117 [Austropuccinia psidii MF-1]|uniref:Reverse transcriptase domain-containing protein n=1 Tax=Austropuccinia psidii MF-1 TaxID=1389203 RepID=A0A9Q3C778_9BASI|nr:hypothetical protein [Austropuccinia psidii MF-1]